MNTCQGCPSTWTGSAMAHCGSCHNTFASVQGFDSHIPSTGDVLKCKNPRRIGMHQNARGTWLADGERDVSEIHRLKGGGKDAEAVEQ